MSGSYTPQQPHHAAYYTANAPSASHPEYRFLQTEDVLKTDRETEWLE